MLKIYNKSGRLLSILGIPLADKSSIDLQTHHYNSLKAMEKLGLISIKVIEDKTVKPNANPIVIDRNKSTSKKDNKTSEKES